MKKLLCALMMVLFVGAVLGCGGGNEPAKTPPPPPVDNTTK